MPKDNGGWASLGSVPRGPCPKCGEVGPMVETQIYGKRSWTHFCNVCAQTWITHEDHDDPQSDA